MFLYYFKSAVIPTIKFPTLVPCRLYPQEDSSPFSVREPTFNKYVKKKEKSNNLTIFVKKNMKLKSWCDNRSIGIYVRQIDLPKINLLLFKYKSGMWDMTKREMDTLKKYFDNI